MDFLNYLKNNKVVLGLGISICFNICLVGLGIYGVYYYRHNFNVSNNATIEESFLAMPEDEINEEKLEMFYVEIKGAVAHPGVYQANSNNIINDIVKLAGGFAKKAYTRNINLSRKVTSELVIYVFTESEYKSSSVQVSQPVCKCETYDISNCLNNSNSEIVVGKEDSNLDDKNEVRLININTASKSELMTLNGIGESKANDIISYRTTNGNFKNISDIKNVSGIGDSVFEKIKDYITV